MIPSPFKRLDFWSVIPLQTVMWTTAYGLMQASVQRYSSVPSKQKAIRCVLGVMPGAVVFMGLSCLCGLVMFAYYAIKGCDPLVSGQINDVNQLLLYLVMEILYYPGVPGLFIAAVFCSSLSSLSSQLTAMAAFTWDDLLRLRFGHLNEKHKTTLLKVLVCLFGFLSTCVGFLCLVIKGTLIKLVIMFTQAMFVPLGIIFINGAALPKLNLKGSLLSCLVASFVVLWMVIGGEIYDVQDQPLPLPLSNCPNMLPANNTLLNTTTFPEVTSLTTLLTAPGSDASGGNINLHQHHENGSVFFMYRISHYWYGPIGLICGLFSSCIFSLIPYFQEDVLIPENLIFPFIRCCFKTQKVSEDVDSKDFTEHTENDNKNVPYEGIYKENSVEVDSLKNTQKWMYESPHREIVETQHIYCL